MDRLKAVAWPGYAVAVALIAIPILDLVLGVWPLRPRDVSWRFGTAGLLSRTLLTPMLGLLLAYFLSLLLGHRRFLRSIAIVSFTAITALAALMILFMLDALQMRAIVRPEVRGPFEVAAATALLKFGLTAVVLLAYAIPGWRASRKLPVSGARAPASATELVMQSRKTVQAGGGG